MKMMGKVCIAVLLLAVLSPGISGRPESQGTPTNPCAAVFCAADTKCVVKQVQCFTTPCNPTASCEPINVEKPVKSCDTMRCEGGYKCVLKQVQCVRAPCPPLPTCVKEGDQ